MNPGSRDLATGQVEPSDVQVETGCTGRVSALSTNQHSELILILTIFTFSLVLKEIVYDFGP